MQQEHFNQGHSLPQNSANAPKGKPRPNEASTASGWPALVRWLLHPREPMPELDAALIQQQRLGPILADRLRGSVHPLEQMCAMVWQENFQRQVRLRELWLEACELLRAAGIDNLTQGSPPYAARLYGSSANRFSQDIDLLVMPANKDKARSLLLANGWSPLGHWGPLTRDGIALDLHDTPGDEARFTALRAGPHQSTEQLFEASRPCALNPHTRELQPGALAVNRLIHLVKHRFAETRHLLDLILLLRETPRDDFLRALALGRAGDHAALLARLLDRMGIARPACLRDLPEPAWLGAPWVQALLDDCANFRSGPRFHLVIAQTLPGMARWRYLLQSLLPPTTEHSVWHGQAGLGVWERTERLLRRARRAIEASRRRGQS